MIIYDRLPVASGHSLTRVGQEHFCLGPRLVIPRQCLWLLAVLLPECAAMVQGL